MSRVIIKHDAKNKKVFIKINNLDKMASGALRGALFEIGQSFVKHARNLMEGKKTGRIYKINGGTHQASAPGEPAASLSGAMSRNLNYKVKSDLEMEFGHKKQSGVAPYAIYIEEGTSRMKARKIMEPTIKDKEKDTENTIIRYIDKGLK